MDVENAENARWVAVDILKKMEQLEFCMDVLATYIETMEDKMESIQQESDIPYDHGGRIYRREQAEDH